MKLFCHLSRVNRKEREGDGEGASESCRAGLDPFPCDTQKKKKKKNKKAARATNGCNVVRGKSLDC